MLRYRFLLVILSAVVLISPLQAATINVPGDFATIQGAIADNGTVNGDEIVVQPGTYLEQINLLGKAITVRSASGDPVDTAIDGTGHSIVVICWSGEGAATVLDGFAITGSTSYGMYNEGTSPTVTNCTLSGSAFGMYNYFNSSPPTAP